MHVCMNLYIEETFCFSDTWVRNGKDFQIRCLSITDLRPSLFPNLPLLPPKVSRLPLSRLIIKGPQKTTTFDGSHEGGNPPYLTSKKRLNQSGGIEVSTV